MPAPAAHPASVAELLTRQFYQWEQRGRGWLVWPEPVELEPPFRPFEGHSIPQAYFGDDGRIDTWGGQLGERLLAFFGRPSLPPPVPVGDEIEEPWPEPAAVRQDVELQVALPPSYQPPANVFEQCLFSLDYARSPLAFEVVGTKDELVAQLVAERSDAGLLQPQLKAHFPEASLTPTTGHLRAALDQPGCRRAVGFGLEREFMVPLRSLKELATDPLVAVCGALEALRDGEAGVLQILFQPARWPWPESILRAVTTSRGEPFFANDRELVAHARHKVARPLYAVVLRVGAVAPTDARVRELLQALAGALRPFSSPLGNRLEPLDDAEYPDHFDDLLARQSRRSGMLLNSDELVALAHLPSAAVRSSKLRRQVRLTRPVPSIATGDGVVLGENEHENVVTHATLRNLHRLQHTHLIGASGTGKSTLLLNLILQDIALGHGVGVLDPHGDLIDTVLGHVPRKRWKDVILFDPSDDEHPIGFNILSAHSNTESLLLASDLVGVFRRLSTSWGDQMSSVLGNAILAFLESSRGGTLADLRRFLVDEAYRREFLATVTDSQVVGYWEEEFKLANKASIGSILVRLDTLLRPKAVRHVVGQKENRLDFGQMMDEGKIFLARLPQGLIGEENSYLLGSLLVSKFQQLAIARQRQEAKERRPFFLHLDEFHHFITPTLATILTGARKYGLGLTLAHQSLSQLSGNADVAAAVRSVFATVCFRVNDDDARKIADGFGHFEATDIQNLPNYEALCRVEKKENDFNLRIVRPPELDGEAPHRCDLLRSLSRQQYARPRQEVEEELARSRYRPKAEKVDPFRQRTAQAKAPEPEDDLSDLPSKPERPRGTPPPMPEAPGPRLPGKGSPEHRGLQQLVVRLGNERGWTGEIEDRLGIHGDPDVLLRQKDGTFLVVEVALSPSVERELDHIAKRFAAGAAHVVVLVPDPVYRNQIRTQVEARFADRLGKTLHVFDLDAFAAWLDSVSARSSTEVHGDTRFTTHHGVASEEERRRQEQLGADALKRGRKRRKP